MVKLGEVAQMANVDPGDVKLIVHVFQANECNFIVSSLAGEMNEDPVLDMRL
jgi:selenophosphate synthetase-related protein